MLIFYVPDMGSQFEESFKVLSDKIFFDSVAPRGVRSFYLFEAQCNLIQQFVY
jgi:hypothetical protein